MCSKGVDICLGSCCSNEQARFKEESYAKLIQGLGKMNTLKELDLFVTKYFSHLDCV